MTLCYYLLVHIQSSATLSNYPIPLKKVYEISKFRRLKQKLKQNSFLQGLTARWEKVLCKCNSTICTVKLCKVKAIARNVTNANIALTLKTKISAKKVRVTSYYKFSNNEYRPMLIVGEYDFCA